MSLPSPWTEPVWQAICDLSEESEKGVALREDIWIRTGAPTRHLVDEAIKTLIETRQCVLRIKPGVFAPVAPQEEDAISFTVLHDSRVKLEVGDVIVNFTARGWARLKAAITGNHMIVVKHINAPAGKKTKAAEEV